MSAPIDIGKDSDMITNNIKPNVTDLKNNGVPRVETSYELVANTRSSIMFDPTLYENDYFVQTFSWSTNHQNGYKIFQKAVHPYETSNLVKHLSQCVMFWHGPIDYSIMLAGTGFNSGKLILVYTPPGVLPQSLDMPSLTLYPHVIMDVKSMDALTVSCMDVTRFKYHIMNAEYDNEPKNTTNMDSVGGYISLWVMNQLTGGPAGVSDVPVNLFAKLGNGFIFSTFQPPSLSNVITVYENIIFPTTECLTPSLNFLLNSIYLSGDILSDSINTRAGLVDTNGVLQFPLCHTDTYDLIGLTMNCDPGIPTDIRFYADWPPELVNKYANIAFSITIHGTVYTTGGVTNFSFTGFELTPTSFCFRGCNKSTNQPTLLSSLTFESHLLKANPIMVDYATPTPNFKAIIAPKNESLVYFKNNTGSATKGFFQTNGLSSRMYSLDFKNSSSDHLIGVYNLATSQLMDQLRLTRQGVLTCGQRSTPTSYSLDSVYFKIIGTIPFTGSLPSPTLKMLKAQCYHNMMNFMSRVDLGSSSVGEIN